MSVEHIEKAIHSTQIYKFSGVIWPDHGHNGAISHLILKLGLPIDLYKNVLCEYYSCLGHDEFLKHKTIYSVDLILEVLSKELSQLLGFFIDRKPYTPNPTDSLRFFPNIAALNARFEILKQAAHDDHIQGSENIADISFYPSPTKDFSSLEYLKQVALGRFPLSTFLDGGGILAFHDLIHTAQLGLTRDLIQGYSDLAKDFLMFLEFLSNDGSSNILTHRMSRMIDGELGNFIWHFMAHNETAVRETLKEGIDENDLSFGLSVKKNLKKQSDLQEDLFIEGLDAFKKNKNSGQPNASVYYSAAEAPNSFIGRVNFVIDILSGISEEKEFDLRNQLTEFVKSDYGVKHNLQNKIYFSHGAELFIKVLEHRHFMQTLATHEGIKQLLKFPK